MEEKITALDVVRTRLIEVLAQAQRPRWPQTSAGIGHAALPRCDFGVVHNRLRGMVGSSPIGRRRRLTSGDE
ncbi:hypothetical protein [Streptomyces sp. NPDC000395]|uniref:hypothetical protein n=1 Tax=Streptomyces sp. NPDC000395 TaxID=3154252 RepID=UPI00336A49DF